MNQLPVATFPDEVELYINMLAPVMMYRIFHQSDGRLVVYQKSWCEDGSSDELS